MNFDIFDFEIRCLWWAAKSQLVLSIQSPNHASLIPAHKINPKETFRAIHFFHDRRASAQTPVAAD